MSERSLTRDAAQCGREMLCAGRCCSPAAAGASQPFSRPPVTVFFFLLLGESEYYSTTENKGEENSLPFPKLLQDLTMKAQYWR